jgi:hypothetical protein
MNTPSWIRTSCPAMPLSHKQIYRVFILEILQAQARKILHFFTILLAHWAALNVP